MTHSTTAGHGRSWFPATALLASALITGCAAPLGNTPRSLSWSEDLGPAAIPQAQAGGAQAQAGGAQAQAGGAQAQAGGGQALAGGGQAPKGEDDALKQANNPLANMKALNLQNYYIPEVSGTDDVANMLWVRYAQPVAIGDSSWLVRASLPVDTLPTGAGESESGLGDGNVFAAYLFDTGDPSVSFGVGPLLGAPTATDDALGTDQWSAGAAAVLYNARSALIQWGGLVTYQTKIAGSDRVDDVNLLAVQPFGMLQLGDGVYFRSVGIWTFDLDTGDYAVPLGAGLGKVVKAGDVVFNLYVEPQFTVLHDGFGQPEFQLLFGFNTQILGK